MLFFYNSNRPLNITFLLPFIGPGVTPGSQLRRTSFADISYIFRRCLVDVSYISRSFKGTGHVRHILEIRTLNTLNMGEADPNQIRSRGHPGVFNRL